MSVYVRIGGKRVVFPTFGEAMDAFFAEEEAVVEKTNLGKDEEGWQDWPPSEA